MDMIYWLGRYNLREIKKEAICEMLVDKSKYTEEIMSTKAQITIRSVKRLGKGE